MSIDSDFKAIQANVKKEMENKKRNALAKLKSGASDILKDSNNLVPVDTGFLESSGKVEVSGNEIIVSYSAPYAIAVHEDLSVPHPVGQAKFLELAFVTIADKLLKSLQEEDSI